MKTRQRFLGVVGLILTIPLIALSAVNVTVNGSNYSIPQTNEKGWGTNVTTWIQAISANTLQPSGGTFTLTADTNFGSSYGLVSSYFKSRSSNIASSGVLRLANNEGIGWRNAANSADFILKTDTSNNLEFNGADLITTTSTSTLTNKTIDANSNTITNIEDGDIALSANIDRVKLAIGSGAHVIINDGSTGRLSSEAQLAPLRGGTGQNFSSSTGLIKVSSGTFSAATLVNADVSASAAINWSKMESLPDAQLLVGNGSGVAFPRAITGDISFSNTGVTAIASGVIVNADVNSSAAINWSKMESLPSAQLLVGNGSNVAFPRAITGDISLSNTGVMTISRDVASKTSAYTLVTTDDVILASASGGAFTLTLPTASGNTGKVFWIKKTDSSTNAVTLDGNGSETIDGATTRTLAIQNEAVTIVSDGTNWVII